MSKRGTGKWCKRGATILAWDGAKMLTISWTRILSGGPYGEAQCFPAGGRGHDKFVQQASIGRSYPDLFCLRFSRRGRGRGVPSKALEQPLQECKEHIYPISHQESNGKR